MATDFELAVFSRQLQEVLSLPEAARWTLERDDSVPLGIFVTVHPRSRPEDTYKARIHWTGLYQPPSLKFINSATGAEAPDAWPKCFGFRPPSLDACLPWTAEGHKLHPEWQRSPVTSYPNVEAPIQYALLNLQAALDHTYEGRGGT